MFSREDILQATLHSTLLALLSALLATLSGTLTAFALPALPSWKKRLVDTGLIFPMVLPEIAIGLSYLVCFIKLQWPLGWSSLLAAHFGFSFAYATLVMKTRVESLDHSLVDAARDLGARRLSQFRHALFPQLVPGILASLVTCFSLSFDDFLISFFTKGLDQMTLPIQIYSMMKIRMKEEIYALSLVLFCISMGLVLVSQLCLSSKKKKSSAQLSPLISS